MTDFTPLQSALGGALIGASAVLLMAWLGRIAGMTGIVAGLVTGPDRGWRAAFLLGAAIAPAILSALGVTIPFASPAPPLWVVLGGLIVGIGVSYGGGCTSGHGICGNARLSRRSIVATISFMLSAFVTVYVVRHLLGGF